MGFDRESERPLPHRIHQRLARRPCRRPVAGHCREPWLPAAAPDARPTQTTSPADQRSQLANFYSQLSNTAAWVHAPLDLAVPAELPACLVAFKQGLASEAFRSTGDLHKAYDRAAVVADLFIATAVERAQLLRPWAAGANPPPNVVAQWEGIARGHRLNFKGPRAILDETVRAAGGVVKAAAVPGSPLPLPNLPPAPARALSSDFDVTPPYKRIYATGPSGTNFGSGQTNIKMSISVVSDSETPLPLRVKAYWIGSTGNSYRSTKADERGVSVSGGQANNFEVTTLLQRTNGVTSGALLPNILLPYRGWVVTLHDNSGARIGYAASQEFLIRYVP